MWERVLDALIHLAAWTPPPPTRGYVDALELRLRIIHGET